MPSSSFDDVLFAEERAAFTSIPAQQQPLDEQDMDKNTE